MVARSALPTLYIIHGWTYTVEPWATTLADLKKFGIPVEMLHVPGLTSPSKKVFTIADYVAWAAKSLPDGAIALGHSNGGRILLNLSVAHPDKLKHLILLDSAGIYEEPSKTKLAKKLARLGAPLKKSRLARKLFHKLVGASDYDHAPENMKKTLSNMLDSDKHLRLSAITTPTTILWGEADTITPPHQATAMQKRIPGATLDLHSRWTHAPYISHPHELASAIKNAYLKALK